MHISPNIDANLSRTEPVSSPVPFRGVCRISCQIPSRMGPIAGSPSPIIQRDILGILQREQDRATALLSSSPLLASLFVSYANQAAALESTSATPPPESEEWKALLNTIATLREEIRKLESKNLEMAKGLEMAEASQEAFRSHVTFLKEVHMNQENDIKSLQVELIETREKYDRLAVDSDAEMTALRNLVLDLEVLLGSCLIMD